MRPSFYMQYAVDKQIEDEGPPIHVVRNGLLVGFAQADDDFAALFSEGIGEDVRHIGLAAHLLIQRTCLRGADEDEREVPTGKYVRCERRIRKTRHTVAPRQVLD